jgi:hypothetical protein
MLWSATSIEGGRSKVARRATRSRRDVFSSKLGLLVSIRFSFNLIQLVEIQFVRVVVSGLYRSNN